MASTPILSHPTPTHSLPLPPDYVTLPPGYTPQPHRFVGLLKCQMDPTLRTFTTLITRIEPRKSLGSKASNARKKTKKGTPAVNGANGPANGDSTPNSGTATPVSTVGMEWEIECEDTVIFPEGGGQPCDHGTFTLISPATVGAEDQVVEGKAETGGLQIPVKEAFRQNLSAVHIVQFPADYDPAKNGWAVRARIRMEVDWDRRTYHAQQHTGQHLLSAIFETELLNPTLGWMLSTNPTTQPSYVDLQKPPTQSDIAYVVKRCNEIIQANTHHVRIEVKLQSGLEGEKEAQNDIEAKMVEKLPEDYKDGVVRYVIIRSGEHHPSDELDRNPCCGTHTPHLSSLGAVFIFPYTTPISGPTRHRIFFHIGTSLISHLLSSSTLLRSVGAALECGPTDIQDRLSTLQRARKEGLKREKNLRGEAIRALSDDLRRATSEVKGVKVGLLHREDESTEVDFMYQIVQGALVSLSSSSSSSESTPSTTPANPPNHLFLLSSGPTNPSLGSGGTLLLTGQPASLVTSLGAAIKSHPTLGMRVKGGRKNGRWQGKVVGNWKEGELSELKALVESVVEGCTGVVG